MYYYLSLGANIGEREMTIRRALEMIEQQIGHILRCSSYFYSAPWGYKSENPFCNICCAVETSLSPFDVLTITQSIECALGRKEKTIDGKYQDRIIDIDLIRVFNNGKEICISTPELTLPHKLWQSRDFVTIPLAEIIESV